MKLFFSWELRLRNIEGKFTLFNGLPQNFTGVIATSKLYVEFRTVSIFMKKTMKTMFKTVSNLLLNCCHQFSITIFRRSFDKKKSSAADFTRHSLNISLMLFYMGLLTKNNRPNKLRQINLLGWTACKVLNLKTLKWHFLWTRKTTQNKTRFPWSKELEQ